MDFFTYIQFNYEKIDENIKRDELQHEYFVNKSCQKNLIKITK